MEILDTPSGKYVGKPVLLYFDVHRNEKNFIEGRPTEIAIREAALIKVKSCIAENEELTNANAVLLGDYRYNIYAGSPSTIVFATTVMAVQLFQI